MQMLGGPSQHSKRHGEIIVLPRWAFVHCTALALLNLECLKLRIGRLESQNLWRSPSRAGLAKTSKS